MNKKFEQGFFALETIYTAAALLAVLAIVGLYLQSLRLVSEATNLVTATSLAQKQLAFLQINKALLSAEQDNIPWQDSTDELPLKRNNTIFAVDSSINTSSSNNKLKELHVIISWQEFGLAKEIHATAVIWHE